MNPTILLLIKVLVASLIVGFVTTSIKSWVDRVFMVIMLTSLAGLPIAQSITINLIVIALSALVLALKPINQISFMAIFLRLSGRLTKWFAPALHHHAMSGQAKYSFFRMLED